MTDADKVSGNGPQGSDTGVDAKEIQRFAAMADDWWDPHGKFAPLHRMQAARVAYVCKAIGGTTKDARDKPLAGKTVLDVGCGGGLLSEALARSGATVTGIDAGAEAIDVARTHAGASGLAINYQCTTAEALGRSGARFDAVTALEVIEHVPDPAAFVAALAVLTRPGGTVVLSTLNRTWKSYAAAIVAAEYVLRLLPAGTHDWRRFLRPSEVTIYMRAAGLRPVDICGMAPDPCSGTWRLTRRNVSVNYIIAARKP